jgi:hypothetical protein
MTTASVIVLFVLLGLVALSVTTLVIAVRGGRGPADPPASHPRTDLAGFPALSAPRGALHLRPSQGQGRLRAAAASAAAAVHTARESRTARGTSGAVGARPSPSAGLSSTRLP